MTVISPEANLRATLEAVAAVAVSSFVTYLFVPDGVPEVPGKARASVAVGTLVSLSPTKIGLVALTGATDTFPIPFTVVEASGTAPGFIPVGVCVKFQRPVIQNCWLGPSKPQSLLIEVVIPGMRKILFPVYRETNCLTSSTTRAVRIR